MTHARPHAHKGKNGIDDALIAAGRFHLHAPSLAGTSRGADYCRYVSIITHCAAKARTGLGDFVQISSIQLVRLRQNGPGVPRLNS